MRQTTNAKFFWIAALVVVIGTSLFLAFLIWRRTAHDTAVIGREQAIQAAIQACNPSYGLLQVEEPTQFETELTTFASAMEDPLNRPDPYRPVWVVRMRGRWQLVGGPPADPNNPGPFYWDECDMVIDARTGESLDVPIQ